MKKPLRVEGEKSLVEKMLLKKPKLYTSVIYRVVKKKLITTDICFIATAHRLISKNIGIT